MNQNNSASSQKKTGSETVHLPFFGLPRLAVYIRPHRRIFVSMILTNMAVGLFDIFLPLFQSYAINHFVAEKSTDGIGRFAGLYLAFLLVQVIVNTISAYRCGQMEMVLGRDMKKASFDHLQTLSLSYFSENSVGYIHARVISDTDRIAAVMSWYLSDGLWNLCFVTGAVVMMVILNPRLSLTVIFLLPVIIAASAFFQKKLVRLNRLIRDANSRISAAYNESITGALTIKTLVIEDRMQKEFSSVSREMRQYSVRAGRVKALFVNLISFSGWLALALVLMQGGVLSRQGLITLGTLSVFMTYALKMMDPIERLVEVLSSMIQMQVNIERFTRLCSTQPRVLDRPDVLEKYGDSFHPKKENWEPLYGDIEFRDVSFHYDDSDELVLSHFSLKVPQGTVVAIVGETGAGKSTLVNLLCRFYEPTEGQILVDGIDERERSQLWLHSKIGYVLQTPHLFSGSIRENMLYGCETASDDDILDAIHAAGADGILERIGAQNQNLKDPLGRRSLLLSALDGQVGEGGDRLSTGEKQLLSIARAILVRPRIFVLDEATSSVDTETEKLIQKAISHIMKGKTSFLIAHRLSTIREADLILAVQDGRIIEQGSHSELMKKKGYYYRLYTRQFSGNTL